MPVINQTLIFLPVLAVVALTFVAFLKMGAARSAAAKSGMDTGYYRAHSGGSEPDAARAAARHWDNLFELPTLFYAGCVSAFVLGAVSAWTLAFAWGFVAARLVQSLVHMTYNNPMHRGIAFMVGVIFVLALWVNIALAVIAGV